MPVSSLEAVEYGESLDVLQDESTCHQNSILDCIRNDQLVDIHIARLSDAVSSIESLLLFQGRFNAVSRLRLGRTSTAGFHQGSTRMTLLQQVKLRPSKNQMIFCLTTGPSTGIPGLGGDENDSNLRPLLNIAQCFFSFLRPHTAVVCVSNFLVSQ